MERKGYTPSSKVLEFEVIKAPTEVAVALNISASSDVISLKRLRYADHEPIVIANTYLPYISCKMYLIMIWKHNLYTRFSLKTSTRKIK